MKDVEGRNWDKWISFQFFHYATALSPSLNSWQSTVNDRIRNVFCIIETQMKNYPKQHVLWQPNHLEDLHNIERSFAGIKKFEQRYKYLPLSILVLCKFFKKVIIFTNIFHSCGPACDCLLLLFSFIIFYFFKKVLLSVSRLLTYFHILMFDFQLL